jgi:hypothetical protein
LYKTLYPFYDFTKLALDSDLTIGIVQSAYIELSAHFKRITNCEGEYCLYNNYIVNAFQCRKVEEKFDKYKGYIDQSLIYMITLVLDP